jgi:hypothetical protein
VKILPVVIFFTDISYEEAGGLKKPLTWGPAISSQCVLGQSTTYSSCIV